MAAAICGDDILLPDHRQSRVCGREEMTAQNIRSQQEEEEFEQTSLPRADGGKDAWSFLAGCFFIEALVWGFPFSFGIFQEYYTTHPPFNREPSGITIIGTAAMVSPDVRKCEIRMLIRSWTGSYVSRWSVMVVVTKCQWLTEL